MGLVKAYIIDPINAIGNTVSTVINGIETVFTDVFGALSGIVQAAVNDVMGVIAPVTKAVGKVGDAIGKVASGDLAGAASDVGSIFGLATGGIVKATPGGTIVRLGEGGEDELVAPKSKLTGLFGSPANVSNINAPSSSQSSSVSINQVIIQGGNGQQMYKDLVSQLKQQGVKVTG
jgi:hypothetical protein